MLNVPTRPYRIYTGLETYFLNELNFRPLSTLYKWQIEELRNLEIEGLKDKIKKLR